MERSTRSGKKGVPFVAGRQMALSTAPGFGVDDTAHLSHTSFCTRPARPFATGGGVVICAVVPVVPVVGGVALVFDSWLTA